MGGKERYSNQSGSIFSLLKQLLVLQRKKFYGVARCQNVSISEYKQVFTSYQHESQSLKFAYVT